MVNKAQVLYRLRSSFMPLGVFCLHLTAVVVCSLLEKKGFYGKRSEALFFYLALHIEFYRRAK